MSSQHYRFAPFNRVFETVARSIGEMRSRFAEIRKARTSRLATEHLLTHDDRILDDMGISRSDVKQALRIGWDQDPAAALSEIRRRRMQADRQGLVSRAS